ncbi:MAG TPA: phosphoribosyl-ATP diphosphatase [Lachnospiraceae bacterium]|nr:phosphoribosyl-ATP diphosphatase [Lachnospiraceae bacterium]
MNIGEALAEEFAVIKNRQQNPGEGSYTSYLFKKGTDKILKKIGEEATETVIAGKGDNDEELIGEICDLIFHTEVLMAQRGLNWDDVAKELTQRRQKENMNVEKEAKRKAENRTDECRIS